MRRVVFLMCKRTIRIRDDGKVERLRRELASAPWRNDGVAAASSDGGALVVGGPYSSRVFSD